MHLFDPGPNEPFVAGYDQATELTAALAFSTMRALVSAMTRLMYSASAISISRERNFSIRYCLSRASSNHGVDPLTERLSHKRTSIQSAVLAGTVLSSCSTRTYSPSVGGECRHRLAGGEPLSARYSVKAVDPIASAPARDRLIDGAPCRDAWPRSAISADRWQPSPASPIHVRRQATRPWGRRHQAAC